MSGGRTPGRTAEAYEDRFDELASLAHRVAFRLVGSREEARDIAQESMARLFVGWRRAQDHAAPWVSRVAANLAIDHIRRAARRRAPIDSAPHDIDVHAIERLDLVEALAALPRRQREVLVLRYIADLPEAEVAAALGCTKGTVKQHTSRGLATLRTNLRPTEPFSIAPEGP